MPAPTPLRKRLKRYEVPGGIRFVTFSCEHRLPLLGTPELRDVFVRCLASARDRVRVELFAWVVMPEHVHLLVRPVAAVPLDRFLLSLKLASAQRGLAALRERRSAMLDEITREDGSPRFWLKGGGFDRNVRSDDEFTREVRYVHQNPVNRGLVRLPEDWAWSSVRWWMRDRAGQLPCDPPPGDPRAWEHWIGYM